MYRKDDAIFFNQKILEDFTREEKDQLFADITEMYFKKNFGSVSKADFETYLFSFYIEHLIDKGINFDDYIIGRDLGITQARVRSLKERKELKYPRKGYDWRTEFLKYAQNAKYDETKRLVKFSIPDVNVIKDARYYFESNSCYDEYQLNPKLFQCPPEAFWSLGCQIATELGENCKLEIADKKALKEMKTDDSNMLAIKKILSGTVEDGIKDLLKTASKEVICYVLNSLVPCSGIVANQVINILLKIMEK